MSKLSDISKMRIMLLGGIIDENTHETDLIRIWFDEDLMTLTKNGDLWYLVFKDEFTRSPEKELPLAVRFLLNYTSGTKNVAEVSDDE